jgi:prepilin-type processing-associated H-X9-DG protein
MKIRYTTNRNKAMTLIEVIVVIVMIVFLALLLPALVPVDHHGPMRTNCINNLKEVDLAFRLWEGDNSDKYSMQVSVMNGGAMELAITGNVAEIFRVMSNELSTPKILICPEDKKRFYATNFSKDFNNSKISYFVGLDANERFPQMILTGDDNLAVDGTRVRSGILNLSTGSSVTWTKERHNGSGNIGLGDGSVQQLTTSGLILAISNAAAPSRLVIP